MTTTEPQVKISEVLEYATHYLYDPESPDPQYDTSSFSCVSVSRAAGELGVSAKRESEIIRGLKRMGVDPATVGAYVDFDNMIDRANWGLVNTSGHKWARRQQARALWLSWCALMAEEQGV